MRRLTLCILLTPVLTYVMLVAQSIVFVSLIDGKGLEGAEYNLTRFPVEITFTLAALSFAQLASLLIPLPIQPGRGEPVPILSRALLGGFLVAVAIFVPVGALLDIPTYFADAQAEKTSSVGLLITNEQAKAVITAWALSWLFFTALLTYRSHIPGSNAIERTVKQATVGTAVGLALATPWYFVLRRKESCVCGLGTFYSLLLGIWSLIVIGGPLLFMVRRDRQRRNATQGTPSV